MFWSFLALTWIVLNAYVVARAASVPARADRVPRWAFVAAFTVLNGGVFVMLAPLGAIVCLGCFLGTVWVTRYVSLGSLVATLALAPTAYLADAPRPVVTAALATAALVVGRHRSNLSRLQSGTESRLGQRA